MLEKPSSVSELVEAWRQRPDAISMGGGTKPGMIPNGATTISCAGISGILEYEPSEYTFTARAGTPVAEIEAALQEHGQCPPFEPPLVAEGATLGGMIASGLNGPGAFRFGGIRDFILGVQFLTRDGRRLRAGGKVVKNAAGFDVPKFLVGSQGQWATVVEATFKVFPEPLASRTVRLSFPTVSDAVSQLCQWTREPWEFDAIEILTDPVQLVVRLRGDAVSLRARITRLSKTADVVEEDGDEFWNESRSFTWATNECLVKIPTSPRSVVVIEETWPSSVQRRYSIGGNVAWASGAAKDLQEIAEPLAVVRGEIASRTELAEVAKPLRAAFENCLRAAV